MYGSLSSNITKIDDAALTLDAIVSDFATVNPNSIALISETTSRSLSYDELDELSDNLAEELNFTLNEIGFSEKNEVPMISLLVTRDVGMIIAILGILKAGCAYVPVDPGFPPNRQAHIFSHSRSNCLICDPQLYNHVTNLGIDIPHIIQIDSLTGKIKNKSMKKPSHMNNFQRISQRNSNDIAYVLYTSGSTGKPKGVMVSHKSVINTIQWFIKDLSVTSKDKILGLTTYCFDISVLEIFMPLFCGATLIIASSATQKDPFRLRDVLEQYRITVMQATPTTYEMMLASGWKGDNSINLLIGGEAFRPSLIPLITASRSVRNVYGPTETTIWSS
eukprot:gene12734-26825_t